MRGLKFQSRNRVSSDFKCAMSRLGRVPVDSFNLVIEFLLISRRYRLDQAKA